MINWLSAKYNYTRLLAGFCVYPCLNYVRRALETSNPMWAGAAALMILALVLLAYEYVQTGGSVWRRSDDLHYARYELQKQVRRLAKQQEASGKQNG